MSPAESDIIRESIYESQELNLFQDAQSKFVDDRSAYEQETVSSTSNWETEVLVSGEGDRAVVKDGAVSTVSIVVIFLPILSTYPPYTETI